MVNSDIRLEYLADNPGLLPTIAQWYHDRWGKYDPTLTVEAATELLKNNLNTNQTPLTFVAFCDNVAVGTVSLTSKTRTNLTSYQSRNLWIGGFYVEDAYLDQGIGEALLEQVYIKARSLGYTNISGLCFDIQDSATWYLDKGWRKFASDNYQNQDVTLIEYNL